MAWLLNAGQPPPAILTEFDCPSVWGDITDQRPWIILTYPRKLATCPIKFFQFASAVPREYKLHEPPPCLMLQLLFLLCHLSELDFVRLQVRDKLLGGPACQAESF